MNGPSCPKSSNFLNAPFFWLVVHVRAHAESLSQKMNGKREFWWQFGGSFATGQIPLSPTLSRFSRKVREVHAGPLPALLHTQPFPASRGRCFAYSLPMDETDEDDTLDQLRSVRLDVDIPFRGLIDKRTVDCSQCEKALPSREEPTPRSGR
jgi:hypothetical protein